MTSDGSGLAIARWLKDAGHDVAMNIRDGGAGVLGAGDIVGFSGMPDKETTIVFSGPSLGSFADRYNQMGYRTIGASSQMDKAISDSSFGRYLLAAVGLTPIPTFPFDDRRMALRFVKKTGKKLIDEIQRN